MKDTGSPSTPAPAVSPAMASTDSAKSSRGRSMHNSILAGVKLLSKRVLSTSVDNIPDETEEEGIDVSSFPEALHNLLNSPAATPETLKMVKESVEAALRKYRTSSADNPTNPDIEGLGDSPSESAAEKRNEDMEGAGASHTSQSIECLPHPDDLPLEEEVKRRLDYDLLTLHLGLVDPTILLNCGPRLVQTHVGDVEFSVYAQYMIRVLAEYYSKLVTHIDYSALFNFAYYCHSAMLGKAHLHSFKQEDGRVRLLGYGVNELVVKFARLIIGSGDLDEPGKPLGLSNEQRNLLIGEIKSRYPDLLVITKMAYLSCIGHTQPLDPYLDTVCYNPDYELYLAECCMGKNVMDGVPVEVVPRQYASDIPIRPGTTTKIAYTGETSQEKAQAETEGDRGVKARPIPVVRPSRFGKQPATEKAKEKLLYDQADLGRARIIRDTTKFREGIDDFTSVMQWMGEAEQRFDFIEEAVKGLTDAMVAFQDKMSETESSLASFMTMMHGRTLSQQQQVNETLVTGGIRGAAVDPVRRAVGLGVGSGGKGASSPTGDFEEERAQIVRRLTDYDRVKDKAALVKSITDLFTRGGKPELAVNVTEKTLERAMTRTRIVQSMNMI